MAALNPYILSGVSSTTGNTFTSVFKITPY
jgi:hypothetical protein